MRFMRFNKPQNQSPYPGPGTSFEDYDFMTADELAAFMKVSKTTVYRIV